MRFGIDRSHRVKHGALLDAQLLAQVYVELTGGRQIGLGLVADAGSVTVQQTSRPVTVREPRPARPHFAAAEELERHRAFIAQLVNPLWARFAACRLTRASRAVLIAPSCKGAWPSGRTGRGSSGRYRRVAARTCRSGGWPKSPKNIFRRSVGANVTFGRGPNNDFTCDIVAPVVQGVVLKASYSAREAQMAFNGAADRIEKQLRRYINRLQGT